MDEKWFDEACKQLENRHHPDDPDSSVMDWIREIIRGNGDPEYWTERDKWRIQIDIYDLVRPHFETSDDASRFAQLALKSDV